jgi:two-component system, sensor histidine kinase PdtaS
MRKSPSKFVLLSFLCTFFIPINIFCSTDQKKININNRGVQQEMRIVDSLITLADQVKDSSIYIFIKCSEDAYKIAKNINYLKGECYSLNNIAMYYLYKKEYIESLNYLFKSLDISKKLYDHKLQATSQKKIGVIFKYIKSNDKALNYLNQSLQSAKLANDSANFIESLLIIGQIYGDLNETKKASTCFYYALYLSNLIKNSTLEGYIYKSLGIFYLQQKNFQFSKFFFARLETMYQVDNKLVEIGTLYALIAQLYYQENDLQTSLQYYIKSLTIRYNKKESDLYSSSLINVGRSYLLIRNFDSAFYYLTSGLEIAKKLNDFKYLEYGYSNLCNLYLQKKDYSNAFRYLQLASCMKDSINYEKNRADAMIFEAEHLLSEKEQKSRILETENQAQKISIQYKRIQILFLVISLLIIMGLLYYTYRQFIKNKKSKTILQQLNEKLDIELMERRQVEEALKESSRQKELLMREIHHRAKNNFVILISLLSIQKSNTKNSDLIDIISELQNRMRTMVLIHEQLYRNNSVDIVSFGQYILNLATIISDAYGKDGITLNSEVSECMINIEKALPLGLVVNELLTNSYKYAFTGRSTGKIHIKLAPVPYTGEDEVTNWELIIEDDGIGFPESFSLVNASSMGLQLIQTLVDQIDAKIYITAKEGVSFTIIFPG